MLWLLGGFFNQGSHSRAGPGRRKLFIKPLPEQGLPLAGLRPPAPGKPHTSSTPDLQESKFRGHGAGSSLGEQGTPKEASSATATLACSAQAKEGQD